MLTLANVLRGLGLVVMLWAWSRHRRPGVAWFSLGLSWKLLTLVGAWLYGGGIVLTLAGMVIA